MSSDQDSPPQFHRGMTLILALVLTLLLCKGSVGTAVPLQRVLRLEHPAETARTYFERSIDTEQAFASEPEWKQRLFQAGFGGSRPALLEATDAYAEVIQAQPRGFDPQPVPKEGAAQADTSQSASSKDTPQASTTGASTTTGAPTSAPGGCAFQELQIPPRDDRATLVELLARLAILQGEAERPDDARSSTRQLEQLGEPELAAALSYAYEPLAPAVRKPFGAFDLAKLQPGWAREQLELRLAHRTGDELRERELKEHAAERHARVRARANTLVALWLTPALIGLIALLVWLLRDRPELPRGNAAVPAEWTFENGFAVLTRSLVLGLALYLLTAFGLQKADVPLAGVWAFLLMPLPMFWLIHRGLLAPRVLSFVRAFGLDSLPGGFWRWTALVCALFTVETLGSALVTELLSRVGFAPHWSELVRADLLTANRWTFAGYAFVLVAWMPAVQEIFCRGLLFLTLRTRMPAISAALWSAALIGAFGEASASEFTSWVWAGFVFGLAFEKSRSLLPLIACTTIGVTIDCLAYQLLYR